MSDKNKEVSTADEKLSKPSDGVQKTGVISDKDNSREFHKAHTKSHQNDKRRGWPKRSGSGSWWFGGGSLAE